MPSQTDRLNTALAGRYRIERHLGEGGMATVYLCDDLKHDRKVALKLLKPELAAVLGAERFVQEIKTTAALSHPHILPLFDSGVADGFLFYVMPFIDGETLRTKLDRETQLGVDDAVRMATEVLDALEYAHQRGIVHRDIKPENILLHGGHAMVADFGIALAVSAAAGGRMTETGLSLGTPHYMSPEQATAEKEITARSDVYSLGSVLYEMLAGQPPHLGGSAQQVVMKIIAEPVQSVANHRKSVPPNVAAAVARALEKLPADRFESAKAFADALKNPAYTDSGARRAGVHMAAGHPMVSLRLFAGVSFLALALLGSTLWAWFNRGEQPVVSRSRIVLWDTPQSPVGRVSRGVALSPDGATIVFVDSSAAGTQLYAKERNRLDATPLAGTADAVAAAFSPDGAWMAFVTRDRKLKKVPRLGGPAALVADSASIRPAALAWLDIGTILYVSVGGDIRAVGQDGGATRVLRPRPRSADSTRRGVWSLRGLPGGKAVLVETCARPCGGQTDLRVLDLRSNPPSVTVLSDEAVGVWTLPYGEVAFGRRDGGVFAAPLDMATLSFARPPVPVLDGVRNNGQFADLAVSANGTAIYIAGEATETERRVVEPVWVSRAGVVTAIDTSWRMPAATTNGRGLALSPDGAHLAVTVPRPVGRGHDIWIRQLDRAPFALTQLTFDGDNATPGWSKDGRTVLYASSQGGEKILRRRRADATGPVDTLLTLPRGLVEVLPTRDSTRLLLRIMAPPSREIQLWRRGDTSATSLVANPKFSQVSPALSPDGRWLAYASDESGRFEVYVRPYPDVNSGRSQVSTSGGNTPVWSHSGRELFYRNGAGALVAAAVLPGPTFTLGAQAVLFDATRFESGGTAGVLYYDVSADDKRFVMLLPVTRAAAAAPDKLVQITNWAAEVHAKLTGKTPR